MKQQGKLNIDIASSHNWHGTKKDCAFISDGSYDKISISLNGYIWRKIVEKYEYKSKIDEIKDLIEDKKFTDALELADSINWRKIRNINELVVGSDAYEAVGKNEEARDLLLLAHERSPIGRTILYKLCMISLKLKDIEAAEDYYEDFVQVAPHDSQKYILKYNIGLAKGEDTASLIKILEDLKDQDFLEEWAYELAYLYHKVNKADKCVNLCDEIILWFGDGPVVERALELKMLYQPLDPAQEDIYRHIQQKRDGITEITAGEQLKSGEIVSHTIAIPPVDLTSERFNTVNLQVEIKKNIDEIMKATEAGEVNENIDAIKSLVEEIPYLQVEEEPALEEDEHFSVNETFNSYLKEGDDGQLSLLLPDEKGQQEEQVEGQMTIDDVLAEWEKTKRAAEAAMQEAKEKELEAARSKALREANSVLNRLEDAMSKLGTGVVIAKDMADTTTAEEAGAFSIPKLNVDGTENGTLDIPVIKSEEILSAGLEPDDISDNIVHMDEQNEDASNWQPQLLDEKKESDTVDFKEASQIIANVNKQLQDEIDRLTSDIVAEVQLPVDEEVVEEPIEPEQPVEDDFDIEIDDIELPTIQLPDGLFEDDELVAEPEISDTQDIAVQEVVLEEEPQPVIDTSLPIVSQDVIEPDEMAELVDEKVLSNVIADEVPSIKLDNEDFKTFSYFLPINGMKANITQALAGAAEHLNNPSSQGGNICIVGEPGSGKTQMATNLIRVLQKKTGKPTGGVGNINGARLNEKDVQKLYERIQGGCLIIESAGDINKETALTLSLLMEHDTTGTIIIMEDTKRGIDKALSRDASFAKRFTEKIVIPIFSNDELVSFAKTYAIEAGCTIDDMGVLALYNRINLIGRYDHATTISEIADIMDDAIDKASRGGFFNKRKYDKNGNIILKEKDFEN